MLQNITPKQAKALAALLACGKIGDAAKRAGVTDRTITRWLGEPAFRAALLNAEGEAIDQATRQLLALQPAAIGEIESILQDSSNPAAVRLRAAQAVLDYLLKLRELRNVEERLAALEAAVNLKR
jgi:hypothetical protein